MKLILAGASGYVAEEVLRQSLKRADITAVVALSRKPVSAPSDLGSGSDASKLRSVVIKDYEDYPEDVRKEFAGANACIWTVSITPAKSLTYDFKEVTRVCQTSAVAALKAMHESDVARPFRFLYMSGLSAERDQAKTPAMMPKYILMRGEAENQLSAFAAAHKGEIEVGVVKPGLITSRSRMVSSILAKVVSLTAPTMAIDRGDTAAVMLEQVVNGFESESLLNEDMIRIAKGLSKPA